MLDITDTVAQGFQLLVDFLILQFSEHPVHISVEILFGVLIIYFGFFVPIRKAGHKSALTKEEAHQLIEEYTPESFEVDPAKHSNALGERLQVDGFEGRFALIKKSPTNTVRCLNLSSFDYFSLSTNKTVAESAKAAVRAYGCGSCGPRGFYGTFKPHLDLERDLAKFLGTHSAIVYPMAFATTPTLIPCFAAKGDTLFCDDASQIGVQGGCTLSRSQIIKYRHNDIDQLEQLIREFLEKEKRLRRRLFRRWIVTEGVFRNLGDMCRLPEIVALCAKYKFRLILDDSYGFGAVGPTGRGTPEHFGISMDSIDIYISSLATSLGSVGGFCAGSNEVVDHQRIVAAGYVFSASSPPFTATAASTAVEILDKNPTMPQALQANAKLFRALVSATARLPRSIKLIPCIDNVSPICHFVAQQSNEARIHSAEEDEKFRRCASTLFTAHNILATCAAYNNEENNFFPASLRVVLKSQSSKAEIQEVAIAVALCLKGEFA